MKRLRIAVLFGGCSEEHPISVKSAQEVATHLDPQRFDPLYIGITRDGRWKRCECPDPDWEAGMTAPAMLSPDRGVHGFLIQEQGGYQVARVDVILPVLHGKLGEDGAVQGLLELAGVPYVGCDVQSSALCMDKSLAYLVATSVGIAVPRHHVLHHSDEIDSGGLAYPVFVKPARSGSSFGVSKASNEDDVRAAVALARRFDAKVLIEEAVDGREVGCAVLGNGADLITGEPDRVALSHGFFRIHQEEQPETGSENATFIVPADITSAERILVLETAKTLYRALGCRGLARVDLFLCRDGSVLLNEVNTLPGLTSYSRFPRMMAAAGAPLGAVIDTVVSLAMDPR